MFKPVAVLGGCLVSCVAMGFPVVSGSVAGKVTSAGNLVGGVNIEASDRIGEKQTTESSAWPYNGGYNYSFASMDPGWTGFLLSKPGYDPYYAYRYVTPNDTCKSSLANGAWVSCDLQNFPLRQNSDLYLLAPDLVLDDWAVADRSVECARFPDGARSYLRVAMNIANVGNGPLEMQPVDDTTSVQTLYVKDGLGAYEYPIDEAILWDDFHDHYHYQRLASMQLKQMRLGTIVAESHKVSYCAYDYSFFDGAANSVFAALYPWIQWNGYVGCDDGRMGLTPGFSDLYAARIPGQFIEITHVTPGTYYLQQTVNLDNLIVESDYSNNQISVPVYVDRNACDHRIDCRSPLSSTYGANCDEYLNPDYH